MNDEKFPLGGPQPVQRNAGPIASGLSGADTMLQHSAEIVILPGLHQRPAKPTSQRSYPMDATIINFPAPRWQQNAKRKNG